MYQTSNKHHNKVIIMIFVVLGLLFLWTSCKQGTSPEKTSRRTVTATLQPSASHLFYNGTIQPIYAENVISPIDGVVDKMYFRYGNVISQNQRLFTIISSKVEQDYHTALTDYLKAKDEYLRNKTSFEGTTALYKAQIIDKEDYSNEKSVLEASELAYINAEKALLLAAQKIPGKKIPLETLTLSNIEAIKTILEKQSNLIDIYSPSTGIALFTKTDQGGGGGESKPLSIGAEVKEGQILVSIGRIIGISVVVYVNETVINKIKPGQEVTVTSSALPNITFKGRVVDVASQAKSGEGGGPGGGLPTFPVSIIVFNLTDQQRDLIKVGMSAKVEIIIQNPSQIKVPIDAVFEKNGMSMVTVIDPKTGATHDVSVQTGDTDLDQVIISSGLKVGDKVIVP
jgi:HlyD family secretion protein